MYTNGDTYTVNTPMAQAMKLRPYILESVNAKVAFQSARHAARIATSSTAHDPEYVSYPDMMHQAASLLEDAYIQSLYRTYYAIDPNAFIPKNDDGSDAGTLTFTWGRHQDAGRVEAWIDHLAYREMARRYPASWEAPEDWKL